MASDKVKSGDDEEKRLKKEKKAKEKAEKAEKKDKKEKKEKKRSESEGVHKSSDKKDKKEKKARQDKLVRALDAHLQADAAASAEADEDDDDAAKEVDPEDRIKTTGELVPFALPLADDKTHKKIYRLIKKGAKLKAIHRGVKECEKAIKKTPLKKASAPSDFPVPGLVVIAGDISPMDVIMHFPILCEEHGVPYLYIRSRADLGVSACTKRATSVVMLRPEGKKGGAGAKDGAKSGGEDDDGGKANPEEYREAWQELVKLAQKQWNLQVEPWVKGTHPLQMAARAMGVAA